MKGKIKKSWPQAIACDYFFFVLLRFSACSNRAFVRTPARCLSWDRRRTGRGRNLTLQQKGTSHHANAHSFAFAHILLFPVVRLPWPAWASGTLSLMILQASYTGVHGSNCIVFTTLHWRMQILSDRATILAGSTTAAPTYAPEQTQKKKETWSHCWLSHRLRWNGHQAAIIGRALYKAPVSGMHRGISRGRLTQVTHVSSAVALREAD